MKKTFFIIAAFCLLVVGCGEKETDDGAYGFERIVPDTNWYRFAGNDYTISTMEELVGLSVLVEKGRNMVGKTIKLGANITLAVKDKSGDKRYDWQPIGSRQIDGHRPFKGTFDGNGFTISNVYVNTNTMLDAGLFGWIEGATIKNLGVTNLYVGGQNNVGGLVGLSRLSEIRNCYTTGKVEGKNDYVGGLVGYNDGGKIYDSYSKCSVSGNDYVGGFAGVSLGHQSAINHCYSTGATSGKTQKLGGFVGGNDGGSPIVNCYYNKETSGRQDSTKGAPKTTADMKKQPTYLDWNFGGVWAINSSTNDGYPYLNTDAGVVSQQFTVTFSSQGGTACSPITTTSGIAITLPLTTREGYTFDGWYSAASGGTFFGKNGVRYTVTGNVTMYAHWTPISQQFTITFDSQGGSDCFPILATSGTSIILPATTRIGFVFFDGWYSAASGGTFFGNAGDSYVVTQNLTMYARWTQNPQNCEPPSAPTNVTVSADTTYNYIKWNPSSNADSYEVYRADSENDVYRQLANIPATTTFWEDRAIGVTDTSWYKISAVNECGEGEFSVPARAE
ncbi:MAG: InlB B-repeat-containing protein [Chitinivibrionia bacterium]|nr:InlB B-repeat-containing protein [Chitinivibrionia bacterium]